MAEGLAQALGQRILTSVAKRRVPKIVPHGNGLRQILVQPKRLGNGSGDSGNFKGVGQPGAVVVTLRLQKDLRLVHQPPERLAVDDTIRIPLIAGAYIMLTLCFFSGAPLALIGKGRQRVQPLVL